MEYRYELKFLLTATQLHTLLMDIRLHPLHFQAHYPERVVNSLYFDTLDFDCYRDNLTGLSKRSKVRYRWYGSHFLNKEGQLQVKTKSNYLGSKLIFRAKQEFYNKNDSWRTITRNLQKVIEPQAKKWLEIYYFPTLINSYYRKYYIDLEHKIRITVDHKQTMYEQVSRSTPNTLTKLNIPNIVIMEVKFAKNSYETVSQMLKKFNVRLTRYSKYAHAISHFVEF
ncbi:VTC domain-containing protein [Candidatus Uabimicrobium sp. HlEnr_7]|uniref:VTC domain-containing protein n=1 Tax=Candidatus Uabimicrobium helgolandensis TaxID=3095367 RepID=UPI003556F6DD